MCFARQVDEAALQSGDDSLSAVFHFEAEQDDADVRFDGGFRDAERGGDAFVAMALNEKMQHFALARAEVRVWSTISQRAGDGRRQKFAARDNSSQRIDKRFVLHAFDDVGARAGFQRLIDVFVALVGGEHDKACGGIEYANATNGFNAADPGQSKIHQRDVGPVLNKD